MIIALILILFALALFLIFHDDHDDSYTRRERNAGRNAAPKSFYDKAETPKPSARKPSYPNPSAPKPLTQSPSAQKPAVSRPSPIMDPRTIVPKEKEYRPGWQDQLDFHFLDGLEYDAGLPERTMSSFIAGLGAHCSEKDLGGMVGWVSMNPSTELIAVYAADGRLMGSLPKKDKEAYVTFNPSRITCPFAGHVALSVTGRYYADIRIVLPSSRDFVEESLTGFLS